MSSPSKIKSTTNHIRNEGNEGRIRGCFLTFNGFKFCILGLISLYIMHVLKELDEQHPLIASTGNDATAKVLHQLQDSIVDGGEHANPIHSMRNTVVGAAIGSMAVLAVGHCTAAVVPAAMSWFGTVVPGVGTIHASFATRGAAATLQVVSARLLSGTAITVATVIGGGLGSRIASAT